MLSPIDLGKINVCLDALEVVTPLTPNIINGPYENIKHYLDIHTRLLREDFIAGLRDGIAKYKRNINDKHEAIEVYNKIRFLNMELIDNELYCYRIQYNISKQPKNSEGLKFGSLLCFTNTNFDIVFFGRIICGFEESELGHLIVGFDDILEMPRTLYKQVFSMATSTVYFEPYYQVLNALSRIQAYNFPMSKYIVHVQDVNNPPMYLLQNNFYSITYQIENHTFSPLKWDRRMFYGLNDAQNLAFKAALSREFSVIQGPPGTGKTFLGLRIAQALMENTSFWYHRSPMLVICYSNHALDQFLEGLLKITTNILRVGNRSKNEVLAKFNINEKRNKQPTVRRRQLKQQLNRCRDKFATITEALTNIELHEIIVDFDAFSSIIPNYERSWFKYAKSQDIRYWLLGQDSMLRKVLSDFKKLYISSNDEGYNNGNNIFVVDNDSYETHYDMINNLVVTPITPLFTIKEIREEKNDLQVILKHLERNRNAQAKKQEILDSLRIRIEVLEILKKKHNWTVSETYEYYNFQRPHRISISDRWSLYWHWLEQYKDELLAKRKVICTYFQRVYREYRELCENEDVEIMKNALVVGMTTSGAARLRTSLESLKSPIVIVEEAAEVLEAHIICALTSHCKHLILLGDHQQLRPSTADYTLGKRYKLDVSLFERMFLNNIQCHTLNVQHRMRPEISCLISPSIYPVLYNHASVMNRPVIRGIDSSVYFIDHHEPEQSVNNSKKNVHEANFLLNLANYLILNGYESKSIVILGAYQLQVSELRLKRKQYPLLQDLQITTLDNYQGEESDIVLLSLVRNNNQGNIGFLRTENRVCVALSRARNGLYIMGNKKLLCNNSAIWAKILLPLEKQKAVGPYLTLRCQIHTSNVTKVSKPGDNDWGCTLECGLQLKCGYTCKEKCPMHARGHLMHQCKGNCKKWSLLKCGHGVTVDCYFNPANYQCKVIVNEALFCDHVVQKFCYDNRQIVCQRQCDELVEACGHSCINLCHRGTVSSYIQHQCKDQCKKYPPVAAPVSNSTCIML